MYKIDIFEKIKMPVDWYMIYWGIKNGVLSLDVAQEYVCQKIERNEELSDEESELAWVTEDCISVLEIIERIPNFFDNMEDSMEKAKEKVRIAVIIFLRQEEKDISKLFEKINMLYAVFDYPVDMEMFISYMPVEGSYFPENHSLEENMRYLLGQLDEYISKQSKKYQLKMS